MEIKNQASLSRFCSVLLIIFAVACQTAPKKLGAGQRLEEARWDGGAYIQDFTKGKSAYLSVDISAMRDRFMRLDASAVLGIYVGSFLLGPSEVRFLSATERKFMIGPRSPELFFRLTKIPISPDVLLVLLFDQPLATRDWTCESNQKGRTCHHKREDVEIKDRSDSFDKRNIQFKTPTAELKLDLKLRQTKVENKDEMFQLEPPAGFKVIQLTNESQ